MEETSSVPKQLESYILKHTPWESVPQAARQFVNGSKELYYENVVKFSFQHQLRWRDSLVKLVLTDEKIYYERLVKESRRSLMMYPYHLSDVLVKGLRITPFRYYVEMMHRIMEEEKSYDSLPNFTAADGVRLLGIGRNQYINIMNKCRQRSWSQFWNKKNTAIRQYLPSHTVPIEIEYWWIVNVGYVSDDDIKMLTTEEKKVIDVLINRKARPAGEFRRMVVHSLYEKQLVYLDVPIDDEDQITVPPLEGFVMNRVLGDYFETLLYKIFVSIDERTTIHELATLLQVDPGLVKLAVSLYIRLGFAKKKNALELKDVVARDGKGLWSKSWYKSVSFNNVIHMSDNTRRSMDGSALISDNASSTVSVAEEFQRDLDLPEDGSPKRTGLVMDASITAFLMMGNLGAGLKSHAVTLFEVGKLADEVLDHFLGELDTVEIDSQAEGEAQTYFSHAITLRKTIRFLRYNKECRVEGSDGSLDLLRCERLESLDASTRARILHKNYALIISMAPISSETPTITSCIPRHFGPTISEVNSGWFKLYISSITESGPPMALLPRGAKISVLPDLFDGGEQFLLRQWGSDPVPVTANNVLSQANDALLVNPILLQLHSHTSMEPENVCIPFPLLPHLEGEGALTEKQRVLLKHSAIDRLSKALDLEHSFGYVRFLNIGDRDAGALESQWVVSELVYGMPLFDSVLNAQVCARIASAGLFEQGSMDLHSTNTRLMSIRFLQFISDRLGVEMELQEDQLPMPGHVIVFDGTQIIV